MKEKNIRKVADHIAFEKQTELIKLLKENGYIVHAVETDYPFISEEEVQCCYMVKLSAYASMTA